MKGRMECWGRAGQEVAVYARPCVDSNGTGVVRLLAPAWSKHSDLSVAACFVCWSDVCSWGWS